MALRKTLAEVKAEFLESSPQARKSWDETASRRALSAILVQARARGGLSQRDLASVTGWDKAYISRLESATDGFPSVKTLMKYLSACGERLEIATYREDAVGTRQLMGSVWLADAEDVERASAPSPDLYIATRE